MLAGAFLASLVLAGLLGSTHCVAMCGAFAVSAGRRGRIATALYSAGRLTSYAALGGLAGTLGGALHLGLASLGAASAAVALVAGLALGAVGLRRLLLARPGPVGEAGPLGRLYAHLVPLVRACLDPCRADRAYLLGVLNGLLPCPVVGPVLLAALASGSAAVGAMLLLALGLGTLPAMLAVGLAGGRAIERLGRTPIGSGRVPGLALLALGIITATRPFLQVTMSGHMH